MATVPIIDHWMRSARRLESPNCDDRTTGIEPTLIVIHCISLPPGDFGTDGVERLFTNRLDPDAHPFYAEIIHLRVSAHLVISRDGSLTQYVPFHRRAWHAGISNFCGLSGCNDFSIGIELEGTDDTPYVDLQYQRLGDCLESLLTSYPSLSRQRIAAHSDIAPGRKTDPGPFFEWSRILGPDTAPSGNRPEAPA